MQTRDDEASGAEATNFSVVRVRRDVLRRSSIGVMATVRSRAQTGPGSNQFYGVDGTFAFFNNLLVQHLLGADAVRRREHATTRATARRWTTRATATACSSST